MSRAQVNLAAAFVLGLAGPALAQGNDAQFRSTTLALSAQGEVRVAPDLATLSLGVVREEATAQAATAAAGRALAAVTRVLAENGVASRDIQTQAIRLSPRFASTTNQAREIVAYQSVAGVSVRLRDLPRSGVLIDAAVAAGANQVSGPSFAVENRPVVERQARDQAVRALSEEAGRVAEVLGQRVVRLVNVNTQAFAVASAAGPVVTAAPPPLPLPGVAGFDPGEIVVRASANGTFELTPK